jgi:malonate transporter
MIVLDSLFPVLALLAFGAFLKHFRFTDSNYLKISDRLVYNFFFPIMLFWKIGSSSYDNGFTWNLCFAVFLALGCMFLLSLVSISLFKIPSYQAGSFAQSCYRFNTYIGVAIILNGLGPESVGYFGVLIGFVIPIINVVAVTTLLFFSEDKSRKKDTFSLILKSLLSNPLILGCLAGLLVSSLSIDFPSFFENFLRLISMLTLPLALISIGGSLSAQGVKDQLPLSLLAAFFKLIVFPVVGYFSLRLFGVSGVAFMVGMIFFALPTSTAIYVLSSQLKSDTELASAAILLSTLLSFPVLTVILLLLEK